MRRRLLYSAAIIPMFLAGYLAVLCILFFKTSVAADLSETIDPSVVNVITYGLAAILFSQATGILLCVWLILRKNFQYILAISIACSILSVFPLVWLSNASNFIYWTDIEEGRINYKEAQEYFTNNAINSCGCNECVKKYVSETKGETQVTPFLPWGKKPDYAGYEPPPYPILEDEN